MNEEFFKELAPRGSALRAEVMEVAEELLEDGVVRDVGRTISHLVALLISTANIVIELEAQSAIDSGRATPEQLKAILQSDHVSLNLDIPDTPPEDL